MAQEVRIVVREERQGTALRDTARDVEALENKRGKTVDYAALQRQRDEAAKAMQSGEKPAADDPRQRLRAAAVKAELEAVQKRAAGDEQGAGVLERKAEVLRRTIGLQQQLGVSEAQARVMASQSVAAEEKIAASKATAATAAQAQKRTDAEAKTATAQKARDEKKAAEEVAQAKAKAARDAAQEEHVGRKREIFGDELKAKEMRAAGDHKGAEALERQNAIRSRAIQIERELGVHRSEASRLATRAVDAEMAVAKKAGWGTAAGQVAGAAGIPGAGLAGPAALAFLAAHIIRETATSEFSFRDTKAQEQGNFERNAGRRRQIRWGTFGDSASDGEQAAYADRRGNKQELDAALAARGTFKNSTSSKLLTFNGLFGEMDGDAAARKNEELIARLQKEKPEVQKRAMEQFATGQGGRELELGRRNAAGDRVGARAVEHEILWWSEYDRLKNTLGEKGEAIAQESANNKVTVAMRQENMKFAGMLNARSGAGDIARVASLINGDVHSYRGGGTEAAVNNLTQTVENQHSDMKSHMPPPGHMQRADLRGRPL